MNHSRGSLPETSTPLGRAADEIERLKAMCSQQDRQITLLVDRLDKASASIAANKVNALAMIKAQTTIENLTHWLQWALNELSGEDYEHTPKHDCEHQTNPERGECEFCDKYWSAMRVAWPERKKP